MGDLKSVVLHSLKISHAKSTFPLALGAKITGVDDATYSSTGESFSSIILPNCESTTEKELQKDDVSLGAPARPRPPAPAPCARPRAHRRPRACRRAAYEFAKKARLRRARPRLRPAGRHASSLAVPRLYRLESVREYADWVFESFTFCPNEGDDDADRGCSFWQRASTRSRSAASCSSPPTTRSSRLSVRTLTSCRVSHSNHRPAQCHSQSPTHC